ncbi:hypothetical protein QMY03_18280 [Arthrobacter sp. KFRI-F3372]|nr:hypothetical protein QMY03_18280 [Arthrobacter sp. KFRI-F3372]
MTLIPGIHFPTNREEPVSIATAAAASSASGFVRRVGCETKKRKSAMKRPFSVAPSEQLRP